MKKILFIVFSFCFTQIIAQKTYNTGLNFDDDAYTHTPVNKAELKRSYDNLPAKVDLKPFCPLPQKQADKSTCVGWAIGFAACTIAEAGAKNITDKAELASIATSPEFIYAYGKANTDTECSKGIGIDKTLLKLYGISIPRKTAFSLACGATNPPAAVGKGVTIKHHARLFAKEETWEQKLKQLKKAVSNQKAIVIGIDCYKSFFDVKNVWDGQAVDFRGGHALCIIGYDDVYEGGCVEVINSWGNDWGNKGFGWIRYADLQNILKYAYDITTDFSTPPVAASVNSSATSSVASSNPLVAKTVELSVQISLKLSNGQDMPVAALSKAEARGLKPVKDSTGTTPSVFTALKGVSHYKTQQAYTSGTRYRLYLDISQPTYLYVLGSDAATGEAAVLFPPDATISPFLSNKKTSIALPDEQWSIEMDNTKGKDYMLFLYSPTPLSITSLLSTLNGQKGAFLDKINRDNIPNLIVIDPQRLEKNQIKFVSPIYKEGVQALCVEIEHQ